MSSRFLPNPLSSIFFLDKFQFSARQQLPYTRHQCCSQRLDAQDERWGIKAPDFSIRLYRTMSEPQKMGRNVPTVVKEKKVKLPKILPERTRSKEVGKFKTFYRAPDSLEAEKMFVKTGKYPLESYKNPKPHNFRPLDEDVPDFITTYEKDPGNYIIKLKTLDTIQNTLSESTVKDHKPQMDTFKPLEPPWDQGLKLPVGPWPPKSASYTRHKRRRGAYSAFLERVEEKLTRSWQNR